MFAAHRSRALGAIAARGLLVFVETGHQVGM
jgi:hypothetical protein